MGCGRQKLNANPLSSVSRFADEHDAAFQLFHGDRIFQHDHFAVIYFIAQVQQTAVGIDHHCLAYLAKLLAIMAAPMSLQSHLVKDTLAPASANLDLFLHVVILGVTANCVNCP